MTTSPLAIEGGGEPELRLAAFSASVQRLRPYLQDVDQAFAQNLLAQALATELVHGLDLLGVTGGQGAGKTTLLREVYSPWLDPWLEENAGRGETVAVVIVEEPNRTVVEARLHILPQQAADRALLENKDVTELREWHQAVRGGREDVVLAELRVPVRAFQGVRRGFLLLPGYEVIHRQNEVFQARMRRQLTACSGFVIVTDHARLAQGAERKILDDLRDHLGTGADLVVAITRTESLSPAQTKELRSSALELFAEDHVAERGQVFTVTTGRSSERPPSWATAFQDSVLSLGVLSQEVRGRQLTQLGGLLGSEFRDMLHRSRLQLAAQQLSDPGEASYEEALTLFDKTAKSIRQALDDEMSRLVAKHEAVIGSNIEDYVHEHESGWRRVGQGFASFFSLRKNGVDARIEKEVLARWATTLSTGLHPESVQVLQQLSVGHARRIALQGLSAAVVDGDGASLDPAASLVPLGAQQTLMVLGSEKNLVLPEGDGVKQAYEMLPALTLSYLALGLGMSEDAATKLTKDEKQAAASFSAALSSFTAENKLAVSSFVGLLGLDLIVDGNLDSVQLVAKGLAQLLGGGASAASLMLPAAGVFVGAAALGAMHHTIHKDEESMQLARRLNRSYALQVQESFLTSIDASLNDARDLLDRRLASYFRLSEVLATRHRTLKAVADLEREADRLRGDLRAARARPF